MGLVFYDQDSVHQPSTLETLPSLASRNPLKRRRPCAGSVGGPQCHDKPTSRAATFAARLDTTTLAPHEIPDDEQTQSETRRRALDVSAGAVEALEDLPQFADRDTNAAVRNVDGNATISGV
jgi:hypothetical protein